MAGWHHGLDGRESGWTPGVGDGQGGLAIHGVTKSQTRLSDWTELNWIIHNILALGVFSIMNLAPKAAELLYCHYFLFSTSCMRYISWQGIEPVPPALEGGVLAIGPLESPSRGNILRREKLDFSSEKKRQFLGTSACAAKFLVFLLNQ